MTDVEAFWMSISVSMWSFGVQVDVDQVHGGLKLTFKNAPMSIVFELTFVAYVSLPVMTDACW